LILKCGICSGKKLIQWWFSRTAEMAKELGKYRGSNAPTGPQSEVSLKPEELTDTKDWIVDF